MAVVFEQGSLRETFAKLHHFTPLSLLLGLSLGFVVGGVLTGYLNPVLAELLGAALGLGLLSLRRTYLLPFLLVVLVPLTFLSVGNAGLLLGLLAVATLVTLLRSSGWKGWQRNIINRD